MSAMQVKHDSSIKVKFKKNYNCTITTTIQMLVVQTNIKSYLKRLYSYADVRRGIILGNNRFM